MRLLILLERSLTGDITIPSANCTYNLYQGQVTYAQVNAQPAWVNKDDLVWYILRWFSGGVDSITIDPTTGSWTWVWNGGITTVTSNDTDVKTFLRLPINRSIYGIVLDLLI